MYELSLGRWVAHQRANCGETDELSAGERERLREPEREVTDLRLFATKWQLEAVIPVTP